MIRKISLIVLSLVLILTMMVILSCSSSKSPPPNAEYFDHDLAPLARSFRGSTFVLGWESTFGGALGSSFDSVGESTIQRSCIEYDKLITGNVTTDYNYSVYTSVEDLATSMNASYSASAKFGIYQSSQKAEMMASLNKKSNTVYAHVRYRVTGPSATLTNVSLTDNYKDLPVQSFVETCGDYYLGNISTGGLLEAIVSIQTSSQQEKADVKYELSQKLGPAKTSIQAQASLEHFLSERDAKVHLIARGCTMMPPVSGGGSEMTYFYTVQQQFYEDVTSCLNKNPETSMADQVTFFTFDKYKPGVYDLYKHSQNEVEKLLKTRFKYELLIADIQDINEHPIFYQFDENTYTSAQVQNLEQIIVDLIEDIDIALNTCQFSPLNCGLQIDEEDNPLTIRSKLPAHIDFYPTSCDDIYRKKMITSDGSYRIYIGGEQTRPVDVYCVMDDGGPRTYLTLADYNPAIDPHLATFYNDSKGSYSQKIGWWNSNPRKHAPDQVTHFEKIRIIPLNNTVEVVINDNQFAQTWTNPVDPTKIKVPPGQPAYKYFVPFGYAWGAIATAKQADERFPYQAKEITATKWISYTSSGWGRARVDFTKTPFAISNRTRWVAGGYEATGTVSFGANRKTANVNGRGSTGYMLPRITDSTTDKAGIELVYVGN